MGYEEYPRHLHGVGGTFCVVHSDAERDRELAKGWSLWPVLPPIVSNLPAEPVKRKPGRPKRVSEESST